ncbi:MAG: double-strand break repair protein AddB [Pseudomonadota bacterium]
MFEPSTGKRIFHLQLGCDFAARFIDGLLDRTDNPITLAQTQVFVTTRRMATRMGDVLTKRGATLWPEIRLVSDLASDPTLTATLPPPRQKLERRLLLAQLVGRLADQTGALASHSARFALAASLDGILAELQRSGLDLDALTKVDLGQQAKHWSVSKEFLNLVGTFLSEEAPRDADARLRYAIRQQVVLWKATSPNHPIILAGSTGSREETGLLLDAIANLPQGAVVMPGFDTDLPAELWADLSAGQYGWDHPQSAIAFSLGDMSSEETRSWISTTPFNADRNRFVSLALTPAPVTHRWLQEGPGLAPSLDDAFKTVSLSEAGNPREEAMTIALHLREAAETQTPAVLITPDRALARQVTAALAKWGIVPDDSAGRPLHQTPVGILLRLVARILSNPAEAVDAIALLKHPLTWSGTDMRGEHLRRVRAIETRVIRGASLGFDRSAITTWIAENHPDWSGWWITLSALFDQAEAFGSDEVADRVDAVIQLAEGLASGSNHSTDNSLWSDDIAQAAWNALQDIRLASDAAGSITQSDFKTLLNQTLAGIEVRPTVEAHPNIAIWGTLEARVASRDLVILGGLNEGIWPQTPKPDPWLNRPMRRDIGLSPPERAVGLSAHDFQQAIAAKHVVLSRSLRDGDAPTVASRWLLRLTNLMGGLGNVGETTLTAMKDRAAPKLTLARILEKPTQLVPKAPRPNPVPPLGTRPKALAVTSIETLIRDPYSIYARYILKLRALDPLTPQADAKLRGKALHKVMERFAKSTDPKTEALLIQMAQDVMTAQVPWPINAAQWTARIAGIAEWLVAFEQDLANGGALLGTEIRGARVFGDLDFTLKATADRIQSTDHGLRLIDYKTGETPSDREVKSFARQLPLTRLIAEAGGFPGIDPAHVTALTYVSLKGALRDIDWAEADVEGTEQGLRKLILSYQQASQGYLARSRPKYLKYTSDYDQLSRFGEWEDGAEYRAEGVT